MAAFVACICTFHSGLPRAQPVSLAWQFYLQHVAIGNQPLFILEVYHSEFAQLPWQHFIPQKEDLESMIKVSFKFNRSFISELILLDIQRVTELIFLILLSSAIKVEPFFSDLLDSHSVFIGEVSMFKDVVMYPSLCCWDSK